jgi:hypothetical protein
MVAFPPTARRLRIVVLRVDTVWCELCEALCATRINYAVEEPDGVPAGLHLLTCCHACEVRDVP